MIFGRTPIRLTCGEDEGRGAVPVYGPFGVLKFLSAAVSLEIAKEKVRGRIHQVHQQRQELLDRAREGIDRLRSGHGGGAGNAHDPS